MVLVTIFRFISSFFLSFFYSFSFSPSPPAVEVEKKSMGKVKGYRF